MAELTPVAIGQITQIFRQLVGARNGSTAHQHRYDRDIPLQRRSNFQTNEIQWVIKAAVPRLIPGVDPARTDHCQEYTASGDILVDALAKVLSQLDTGHVDENPVRAELGPEIAKQMTCLAFGIFSSIADEYGAHGNLYPSFAG